MNHKEDCDIDVQACSTMDCTGLIPSLPQDEAEKEAYEDLYHMSPRLFHRTGNNGRAAQMKKRSRDP